MSPVIPECVPSIDVGALVTASGAAKFWPEMLDESIAREPLAQRHGGKLRDMSAGSASERYECANAKVGDPSGVERDHPRRLRHSTLVPVMFPS